MGGSANSGYVTAPASEADHATMSLSFVSARNESILESEKSGEGSIMSVEEQIEKSKSRWSLLADQSGCMEEGEECEAEVSNVQEFMALQRYPTFHSFFTRFGYDTEICQRDSSLKVGEKFAKSGLAEFFHAQVFWWHPEDNEYDLTHGVENVLKVFKKGTFLKHLKSTLPLGLLQFHAWEMKNLKFLTPSVIPRFQCEVHSGILLKDGEFVSLMRKEDIDLRSLIEHNMKLKSGEDYGLFLKEEVQYIMYYVALGVGWLNSHGIILRDLKESNVLMKEFKTSWIKWICVVANYECSIGVVGIGFFRTFEILQACKNKKLVKIPRYF